MPRRIDPRRQLGRPSLRWAAVLLCATLMPAPACAATETTESPALSPPLQDFVRRANDYADLHRRIAASGSELEPTEDPSEIAARKDELAKRIHDARAGAKPGDIFTPAAAQPLRRLVRSHEKQSLEKEPQAGEAAGARPRVNARYPESEPLPTMPPALLAALPAVPDELQYRLFGRDLALLDTEARIVIDVLPDARP